jgi:hypothetical protein
MSNSNTCYRKTDKDCNRLPTAEQPITLNPIVSSDVFGNEFYNFNQEYIRTDSQRNPVSPQPKPNGEDYNRPRKPFVFDAGEWERKDKDCSTVTTVNPNGATFSVYAPRDYIATDLDNKPKSTVCPIPLTVSVTPTYVLDISDWEFTYENGVFIAREEGYNELVEPELNTVRS